MHSTEKYVQLTSSWRWQQYRSDHPRSEVMVPIDSPWAVFYSTSTDTIIVSLAVFEIFDVKRILMVKINYTSAFMVTSNVFWISTKNHDHISWDATMMTRLVKIGERLRICDL